jgi:predicted DsbA family dithiol-disulfide isomerase
VGAFRYCLASEKYREALWDDVLAAEKMGIDGTPAFVVGRTTPTGVDGEVLVGAQPLSEFVKAFAKVKGVK